MLVRDDLLLIREQLRRLTEPRYFRTELHQHTQSVIALIDHAVEQSGRLDGDIALEVRSQVWAAYQHLNGSTSREVPYEVVHALSQALSNFNRKPNVLITTALLDEPNFFFSKSLDWNRVETLFPSFQIPDPAYTLVQVSLPRLYRTKPLNCMPLYHELAHYLDETHSLSETVLLISGMNVDGGGRSMQLSFLREHFADLFSACYCGDASLRSIAHLSAYSGVSRSHPPTALRQEVVKDFLQGRSNSILRDFNAVLSRRDMPTLELRFSLPDVSSAFDDIRPCELRNEAELHGIFPAGLSYLELALMQETAPWTGMAREDIVRIVNDLVEKSIRNMDIRQRWARAALGQDEDPR